MVKMNVFPTSQLHWLVIVKLLWITGSLEEKPGHLVIMFLTKIKQIVSYFAQLEQPSRAYFILLSIFIILFSLLFIIFQNSLLEWNAIL